MLTWINDYFVIQLLLIFLFIFFFYYTELFFVILNLIFILLLFALYLWLYNADLYTNFLLVIDLGLFFSLMCFLLNVSWLFNTTQKFQGNLNIFLHWIFIAGVYTLLIGISYFFDLYSAVSTYCSPFVLNFELLFFDWADLFAVVYLSDLQLMSDLYFNFSIFEFVTFNFILYIAVLSTYFFYNYFNLWLRNSFSSNLKFAHRTHSVFILKTQDMQRQIIQTQSVKAWYK